jgi:hypothetical protein
LGNKSSLWEDNEPYKKTMDPSLEYGYIKMYRKINMTHVAYRAKNGKTLKPFAGHNYHLGTQMKVK